MADRLPDTAEGRSCPAGQAPDEAAAPQQLNALTGIVLKILSAMFFSGMLAMVKLAGERLPVGEMLFARNIVGVVPVLIFVAWTGELSSVLRTAHPFGHVKRAAVGTAAMGLWFASLTMLPLPDATAISYAAPLMLVALAALLLGEKVRIYRWSAVGVGFVGVLIILAPQVAGGISPAADMQRTGSLLALGAAGCMALASIFVRELTATEQTGTIVIYFFMAAAVMSLVTVPFGWVVPTPFEAMLLIGIGLLGGVGQILLTQAYRFAEASTVAPFEYTTMIWMVLLGFFLFGEVPQPFVIVGTIIVIGAGLYVIYRERKLGLERRERAATSPIRG